MRTDTDGSKTPNACYVALTGYVDLCLSLGIDPGQLLHWIGVDPAAVDQHDAPIAAIKIARLLEASTAESGRADFALQLAERRRLSTLGPLSLVLREESSLRKVFELMMRWGTHLQPGAAAGDGRAGRQHAH